MQWVSLASQFRVGLRRGNMAKELLAKAYANVFMGNATKAEAQMVLADLANESGFYKVFVPGEGVSLEYNEGKRTLYGRIMAFIQMSPEEHRALEHAARQESITDMTEGPIV